MRKYRDQKNTKCELFLDIDVLTKMVYVSLCVLSIDNGETVHDAMIKFK